MLIFLSGLFLFLVGLESSKRVLKKITTARVEKTINRLSGNLFSAVLIGIVVTAIIQSSSAVIIILISLIEAKAINLKTALGIVLGANIGTTITVQIVSLPVLSYYPILILIGTITYLTSVFSFKLSKNIGLIIFSFGIVFAGLSMMTDFFNYNSKELIIQILASTGSNQYLGILIGVIITGIVQSSSVITGITISLARSNLLTLPAAIAIALGSNIGTCITAFIASINTGKIARALARGHFLINLFGVLLILPFINIFTELIQLISSDLLRQIANAHSFFNIINVLVFLPFFDNFINLIGRNLSRDD